MMWARKRWSGRVLAAVLILTMLPTLITPSSQGAGDLQFGSYERWIRAQLRVPVDAAVEQALAEAVESRAASFDGFITAFLDAYAEAAPGHSTAQVFTDRNLSDEALISYLQRRYSQVADEGVLPRVYFTTFVQHAAVAGKSGLADGLTNANPPKTKASRSVIASLAERTVVIAFRTLCSERSLGP